MLLNPAGDRSGRAVCKSQHGEIGKPQAFCIGFKYQKLIHSFTPAAFSVENVSQPFSIIKRK